MKLGISIWLHMKMSPLLKVGYDKLLMFLYKKNLFDEEFEDFMKKKLGETGTVAQNS